MTTHYTTIDGVQYAFFAENGENPLVMLHGFTGSHRNWQTLIAHERITAHYILPDIVGHGDSDAPADVSPYEMSNVAEAVVSSIAQLNAEPFDLLGYSMGGRLALYIAVHYTDKIKSLILESASPGLKTKAERAERRQRDNQLADNIESKGIAWFADYWGSISLWDSQSDAQKAHLRELRLQNNPRGLANSLRGMGTGMMPSLWDNLRDLTLPVQLIVGEYDKKYVAINREMAQDIPQVQLAVVQDAGHTVHVEQPTRYATIVRDFLA